MKLIATVFVAATCAIQSTLAASSRHGHAYLTPDTVMTPATDHQRMLAEESSEFLETIREILFEDLQAPTENHRSLQDDPNCGALDFPCTHGAVCKPDETKDGADWCFCDVANGYMNDPGPDIPIIALHGLQGYRSCVPADECSQMTNVCALGNEGGGCEDRDPENGKYMCFCKEGYLAVLSSIGDHGPEACDQVNECLIFNICGDGKVCIDTPGSFQCQCEEGLIETQNGDCLISPVAVNLESCDPLSGDDCAEPERECDQNLKKCICFPGWIQPAGAGGQCQRAKEVDECMAQTDVACDRRGRGGPDPRSKCINSEPLSYESSLNLNGNPRQGYTCECLPPYYDAPNAIRGTNCLEPDPTPAPVAAIVASSVPSMAPTPPGRPLPCTTFVCTAPFSFCAAKQNRCVCQRGYIQSLGSPFACQKICTANTNCTADEFCFESRCTAVCGNFTSIASIGDELSISNQDDRQETVNLLHPFPWRGGANVYTNISVTTNGLIWLGTGVTNCGNAGVKIGSNRDGPRIAVANEDLNPCNAGSIYVLIRPEVTIVSWEGVPHWNEGATFGLNFQALLHADGEVSIRFGNGNPPSDEAVVAGLDDNNGLAVPATGVPFDANGLTSDGDWPTDVCCRFAPKGGNDLGDYTTVCG